jgi:hypothetical protein
MVTCRTACTAGLTSEWAQQSRTCAGNCESARILGTRVRMKLQNVQQCSHDKELPPWCNKRDSSSRSCQWQPWLSAAPATIVSLGGLRKIDDRTKWRSMARPHRPSPSCRSTEDEGVSRRAARKRGNMCERVGARASTCGRVRVNVSAAPRRPHWLGCSPCGWCFVAIVANRCVDQIYPTVVLIGPTQQLR